MRLDLEQRRALCKPTSVNYYTSSRNHTDVNPTNKLEARAGGTVSSGWVHVVSHVWGWRRVELRTHAHRVRALAVAAAPPRQALHDRLGVRASLRRLLRDGRHVARVELLAGLEHALEDSRNPLKDSGDKGGGRL